MERFYNLLAVGMGAQRPNGARARKITAEVPTQGDTQWFSTETGEPDRLYLLPQDPIAALVGSKRQRAWRRIDLDPVGVCWSCGANPKRPCRHTRTGQIYLVTV